MSCAASPAMVPGNCSATIRTARRWSSISPRTRRRPRRAEPRGSGIPGVRLGRRGSKQSARAVAGVGTPCWFRLRWRDLQPGGVMSKTVDYYFSPMSPWTYLGHARFADMAKRHDAAVNVKPADFGKVFPVSGGLPLAKRAPQRQAYRMLELKRFRDHLKLPLNLQPKFFPVPVDLAAQFIVAASRAGGSDAAMRLAGAVLRACWAEERNIGDFDTLIAICKEQGMDAAA